MTIHDFHCNHCDTTIEEYISTHDEQVLCPTCGDTMYKLHFCIDRTGVVSPKYVEMHRKYELIRKRMSGELPWRKYSESQSD
jgi:uncharacterized Zn finger protein (UPF0148 family)